MVNLELGSKLVKNELFGQSLNIYSQLQITMDYRSAKDAVI